MIGAFLDATIKEALTHRKEADSNLAIAIQSQTPPDREHARDRRVAWCRSLLEMRDHLAAPEPGNLVIVTPLEDRELADDIRARIRRHKLIAINVKEMLKHLYEAREVDSRVTGDSVLCASLLRCTPVPILGGILHEDAAWQTVCPEVFGLDAARPDAVALLEWINGPANDRLAEAPAELRDRLATWLSRTAGPLTEILLAVAAAGYAQSAIGLGLALRVILTDQTQPELAQALVRIERFTGHRPLSREVAELWVAAAEKLLPFDDASDVIAVADRILNELGASAWAWLSRWSLLGNEQLVDRFAADLAELPSSSARLEVSLAALQQRYWPKSERPLLGRLEMAVRLLRWLRLADPTSVEFEDLALRYSSEGSWVDWARTRIRGGYERGPLASALARLSNAVRERRERVNLQFASALTAWNNQGAHFRTLIGVESIVDRYVPSDQPVLVVILDGMSYAVCRELAADPAMRRWSSWSPDGREIPPAVTALPSVTEFSRFSLISGKLARGTQGAEEVAFSARQPLAKQHPPVLFHKNDLAAMADPESLLREIADTRRLIVGIVINAIDDSLSGPVQIAPEWNLEYLAVLRPFLAEASAAGRIVLLTSDHGHVLDYGTNFSRHDGSDRYHFGQPESAVEFHLEGGRVVGPSGVTALGVEGVRYSSKPRNGYHGGITPQECLVPVVVIADREDAIRGWQEVLEARPEWWIASESAPAEVAKPKRKTKQASLFTEESDWVNALITNAVFRQQIELPGNRIKPEQIANALRALDSGGGRLFRPVFASRMNLALVRVGTTVAAMQRVLNYDGYGVLTIDEATDMVILDRPLLDRQFSL
jgi:hypothetical protein